LIIILTPGCPRFQGAEKQYYVSKKCATADDCDREIYGNMPLCHYIW
jgi:hypothetical protein